MELKLPTRFDVSVVLTSCNRPKLLKETLKSFFQMNEYPIKKFIIIDDGLVMGCNDFVRERFPQQEFELIYNTVKLAQIRSIDLAYSKITTPWVFHMEEDWQFVRPHFIVKSLDIMMDDPKVITVWLRSPKDSTLQHKYSDETFFHPGGHTYKKCEVQLYTTGGLWNGFTFNPGLKRMSDYDRIKPYAHLPRLTPPEQSGGNPLECDISVVYAQLGYYAVTLLDQYIAHTGWEHHII